MQRCLQIATNGLGTTFPNPLVGSVIVHKDRIIGEGWHRKSGEPHAEIMAINSVQDISLLQSSTIYVNLEPCSHFGKTPPCAVKIAEMKIPHVVIGCRDIAEYVNGKGIEFLKSKGIKVTEKVMEKESQWLNRRFFTFHGKKRPYIILKYAQTSNGFFAPKEKVQKWITGKYSRQLVHKWRSEEQAVLIGKNTAVADRPLLTSRMWKGTNQPLRILISCKVDFHANQFLEDENSIVFTSEKNGNERFKQIDFDNGAVYQIMEYLYDMKIQSVIVEGGVVTIQKFIDENLWDEARVLTAKSYWTEGISAPLLPAAKVCSTFYSGDDQVKIYINSAQ